MRHRSVGLVASLLAAAFPVINAQATIAELVLPRTADQRTARAASTMRAPFATDPTRNPYTFHKHLAMWSLAAAYATTVVTAAAMDDDFIGTTALPVAGPWITMARIEGSSTASYSEGGKPLLAASGLMQGGLLLYALVSWAHEQSFAPRLSALPAARNRGLGLAFMF